ncbi:MAG: FAD-dependent oxidoreductase [Gammaproteobacteria bacterium]
MVSIAVIGCGIAGTSLAYLLSRSNSNINVTLFDKGRGIGGRMATRYSNAYEHDHGAQFFTARSDEFRQFLSLFDDAVASWDAVVTTLSPDAKSYKRPWFEPHYVGAPRMNSLCKKIAEDMDVHLGQRITRVTGVPGNWFLESDDALSGPFDWVISTAPAPQTFELLDLKPVDVTYEPAFALMVPLRQRPAFDAAVVKDSLIDWVALTGTKPGRTDTEYSNLVAHANPAWSLQVLEKPLDEVKHSMLEALETLSFDCDGDASMIHRWRYARVSQPASEPFLLDPIGQLAACGDWCVGRTVEDAFHSSLQLASELQLHLLSKAC